MFSLKGLAKQSISLNVHTAFAPSREKPSRRKPRRSPSRAGLREQNTATWPARPAPRGPPSFRGTLGQSSPTQPPPPPSALSRAARPGSSALQRAGDLKGRDGAMVEGPCCALFAERLRARVHRGQVVRSARGSALSAEARAAVRNRAGSRILGCAWGWISLGWGRAFRGALACFNSGFAGACETFW